MGSFLEKRLTIGKSAYRKHPLKNTGDTLKGPDGTVLVTDHWVF